MCGMLNQGFYLCFLTQYVLTSADSIWFMLVDWTGEAFGFLSHAQICRVAKDRHQTTDLICVFRGACQGFYLHRS